jgi:hypothetical protein
LFEIHKFPAKKGIDSYRLLWINRRGEKMKKNILFIDAINDSNKNSCEFIVLTTLLPDFPSILSGVGNGGGGNPG